MNYAHGLSVEIFSPGQEASDDQGAFANVQRKRVNAAQAILRKARWRGPARVVAVEPVGDSRFCGCAMELHWCVVDLDKCDLLLKKQVLQFLLIDQQQCVTLRS